MGPDPNPNTASAIGPATMARLEHAPSKPARPEVGVVRRGTRGTHKPLARAGFMVRSTFRLRAAGWRAVGEEGEVGVKAQLTFHQAADSAMFC